METFLLNNKYAGRKDEHSIFIFIRKSCSLRIPKFVRHAPAQNFIDCEPLRYHYKGYRLPLSLLLYYGKLNFNYSFLTPEKHEFLKVIQRDPDFRQNLPIREVAMSLGRHPEYPLCLKKSFWRLSSTDFGASSCHYYKFLLQNLQHFLNFSVQFYPDDQILSEPEIIEFNVNFQFKQYKRLHSISLLVHTDTARRTLFYCELKRSFKGEDSAMSLTNPLSPQVWTVSALIILFVALVSVKFKLENNVTGKSLVLLFFEKLYTMFRTFLRHEVTHSSIVISLLSFLGMLVCSLYENDVTSKVIVPSEARAYENMIELLENGFKMVSSFNDQTKKAEDPSIKN